MGISEASAQPGTATHDAQLGIGYSNTGALVEVKLRAAA